MKEHKSVSGKLRPPNPEVMFYGIVGVTAIDMKQINAFVDESRGRIVKSRFDEHGEMPVSRVMIGGELFVYFRAIPARVFITFPCIYSETLAAEGNMIHRLAESVIGIALMRSKFNDHFGLKLGDAPEGERYVTVPAGYFGETLRR